MQIGVLVGREFKQQTLIGVWFVFAIVLAPIGD